LNEYFVSAGIVQVTERLPESDLRMTPSLLVVNRGALARNAMGTAVGAVRNRGLPLVAALMVAASLAAPTGLKRHWR
jgi:hypothetical protein